MMPLPWQIGLLIRGALITASSRTMASRRPVFPVVTSQNRAAPTPSKLNATTGLPWSKDAAALSRFSPLTSTSARTTMLSGGPSRFASRTEPTGMTPSSAACGSASWSTRWKVSFAVCPSRARRGLRVSMPGTWTRMRLRPCRVMTGSSTPSGSIRERSTSRVRSMASPRPAFEAVVRQRCRDRSRPRRPPLAYRRRRRPVRARRSGVLGAAKREGANAASAARDANADPFTAKQPADGPPSTAARRSST